MRKNSVQQDLDYILEMLDFCYRIEHRLEQAKNLGLPLNDEWLPMLCP